MSKNQKQLQKGEARIGVKDATAAVVTIDARSGEVVGTSSDIQRSSGSGPRQSYYDYEPPPGTETLDHYRFFEKRIDVNSPFSPLRVSEESFAGKFLTPEAAELSVFVGGALVMDVVSLRDLVTGDPVTLWNSTDAVSSLYLEQEDGGLAPTYDEQGFVRFDGHTQYMGLAYDDHFPLLGRQATSWVLSLVLTPEANNPPHGGGRHTIISQGEFFGLHIEDQDIVLEMGTDPVHGYSPFVLTASGALDPETVPHIIHVLREDDMYSIYVDGVLKNTYGDGGRADRVVGPARNCIGRSHDGSSYFGGRLYYLGFDRYVTPPISILQDVRLLETRFKEVLGKWTPFYDPRVEAWFDAPHFTKETGTLRELPSLVNGDTHVASPNSPGTSNQRPDFVVNGINGRPSFYFGQSRNHFRVDSVSAALAGRTGYTISFIIQPTEVRRQAVAAFNTGNGGNVTLFFLMPERTIDLYDNTMNAHFSASVLYEPGETYIITWMCDGATGQTELYVNGNLEISYVSPERPQRTGRFSIGQEWDSGTLSDFFQGYMGSILIGRGYSQDLRERFEAYLTYSFMSPSDIPDLLSMYRSQDLGLADQEPVALWQDLGPEEADAIQSDESLQPVYSSANEGVLFDSTSFLEIPKAYGNQESDDLSVILAGSGQGPVLSNEAWSFGYDPLLGNIVYEQDGETLSFEGGPVDGPNVITLTRRALEVEAGYEAGFGKHKKTFSSFAPEPDDKTLLGGNGFEGHVFEALLYGRALKSYELAAIARHVKKDIAKVEKPDIPNIKFEFDAHVLTGFGPGDLVDTLPDLSGQAQDAVQANTSNQAAYYPYALGSKPALLFESGPHFYVSPVVPATGSEPRMIVAVVGPRNKSNQYNYIASWGGSTQGRSYGVTSCTENNFQYGMTSWGVINQGWGSLGPVPSGKPEILISVYDGYNNYFSINGKDVNEAVIPLNTGDNFHLTVGSNHSASHRTQCYDGLISYVMVAKYAPSQEEVQALTVWLASRFDIAI